jgi:hypothetical protein
METLVTPLQYKRKSISKSLGPLENLIQREQKHEV